MTKQELMDVIYAVEAADNVLGWAILSNTLTALKNLPDGEIAGANYDRKGNEFFLRIFNFGRFSPSGKEIEGGEFYIHSNWSKRAFFSLRILKGHSVYMYCRGEEIEAETVEYTQNSDATNKTPYWKVWYKGKELTKFRDELKIMHEKVRGKLYETD